MVLQQDRPKVSERSRVIKGRRSLWARWDFWSFLVAAVVMLSMLFVVMNGGETDLVHEMMPEYEVDTLAVPAVAARTGGPVITESRYVGSSDANFDPDAPAWWMPEFEVDTLANPQVALLAGDPFAEVHAYVGSSDANFDPDAPAWWMPEFEVDTLADPEVAAFTGGPVVEVVTYVGSSDADFDPDVE